MGYTADNASVSKALDWFAENQDEDGLWRTSYEQTKRKARSHKEYQQMLWVSLAVCRVFRRLLG
jgi:hypothetical protein